MAILTALCLASLVVAWVGAAVGFTTGVLATVLVVIAYVAGGGFSAARAFDELRHRKISIDLLMVTAALGAASVGAWVEGGVLLFLFSLSNTLEKFALYRTRRAIEALLDLRPPEAVVFLNGKYARVPTSTLVVGDVVIVRPGERIPADGVVTTGASSVDQSPMTGESVPVDKSVGDSVFAGTLNGEGSLEVRATRPASDTSLQRIIRLVEVAQSEKAETQRFTDWFGQRYTIGVFVVATLSIFLPWALRGEALPISFYRAMTILVVASPCAVVISIPAAILAAIARGAREGILFKGGAHLERAAKITAIAFDKTGTLTLGHPRLTGVRATSGVEPNRVLQLAASAEARSEHPLARAIVDGAAEANLPLLDCTNFTAIVGRGLEASVDGTLVRIGKEEIVTRVGLVVPDDLQHEARELANLGQTVMYVADESRVLGIVAAADSLRPHIDETLRSIRDLGVKRLIMLTGDNSIVAAAVASRLGIEYRADMLPADKMQVIAELMKEGEFVAMVGDGINDAPSLATATLGVSLGGVSSDVALESADLVLMGGDLRRLPEAIGLARAMNRIVRQNLVFAFGMMAILLISTITVSLRLPFAVVGHEGSTILVILNGLRLLSLRIKPR